MGASIAVPTQQDRRLKDVDIETYKIRAYDRDNNYTGRVGNAVDASGVATACTNLLKKHLRGKGYASKVLETLVVNEDKQTLGQVHKLLCKDMAVYRGYAYSVQYNGLLQVVGIKHVEFSTVRLSKRDASGITRTVRIHPDWGKDSGRKFDQKDIVTVDLFTTDKAEITAQIMRCNGQTFEDKFANWNGHVYYHSEDGYLVYPKAMCDPVFEDVISDAGVKVYKNRQITTGFMCDYIVVYKGKFKDAAEKQTFVDKLANFSGYDRSHRFMVLEAETEDDIPDFTKLEAVDNDKKFSATEESVRESIIRAYSQPKALHSISTQGSLGLSKEIEESKAVYDERTADERVALGKAFEKVLENWYTPLQQSDLIYDIIPITGTSKQETRILADIIGVGGLQSMQSVMESTVMTPQQKVNFMVVSFGIPKDTAMAVVNGTPLPDGTN